ncbi:inward rectifier potassium channel 16 [Brachyhypopomus gauderio]|uniref:inward rectifier potassium channel 16 n=1 Tax=Brachyhypopomus gauderio TaxID=698409 RepID=UPI004041C314
MSYYVQVLTPHIYQGTEDRTDFFIMSSSTAQYSNVRHCTTARGSFPDVDCSSKKRRYVRKDGSCNTAFQNVPGEWQRNMLDIFTTLVEIRWRVMILTFALSYTLSWLLFGILFWVIALAHGDMSDLTNDPCVYNLRSFTAAFLFSLETQSTIGYGARGMSENCMVAIVVVTIQDIIAVFIDTFIIGIVVAKMASARKRSQTVGFSNTAVINMRDGNLCLSWRVGDFRRKHMVEGTASAQLVRQMACTTGKVDISYNDLEIQNKNIILAMPVTIVHRIFPSSPFYKMSLQDLQRNSFELVVSFTYTDDLTGVLHQTRTSYIPSEIMWGQRFQDMLKVNRKHYKVNYSLFHQTIKVPLPEISAEEYEQSKPSPSRKHELPQANPLTLSVEI